MAHRPGTLRCGWRHRDGGVRLWRRGHMRVMQMERGETRDNTGRQGRMGVTGPSLARSSSTITFEARISRVLSSVAGSWDGG